MLGEKHTAVGQIYLRDLRHRRASKFANDVREILKDFLPQNGRVSQAVYEYLEELAYRENLEIIQAPPET